jgi:hypothetical protein
MQVSGVEDKWKALRYELRQLFRITRKLPTLEAGQQEEDVERAMRDHRYL